MAVQTRNKATNNNSVNNNNSEKKTAASAAVKANEGLVPGGAGVLLNNSDNNNNSNNKTKNSSSVQFTSEVKDLQLSDNWKRFAYVGAFVQHIMCFFYCYFTPIALGYWEYHNTDFLLMPVWAGLLSYVTAVMKIAICMSGCLHRFFAHNAYRTSRPMSILLALIACLGGQRGPLWWASKHIRHHKHCDTDLDPHSPQRYSQPYAFTFWTLAPKEVQTNWDYLPKRFHTKELLIIDCLAFFFPMVADYLVYKNFGLLPFCISYWSTIGCLNGTLAFNVIFHWIHEGEEVQTFEDGTFKCAANDRVPGMFKTVLGFSGEYAHEDHHVHPQRAKRPTHLVDVPYWSFIYPMHQLGLIWDVNDGEGNKQS